MSSSLITLIQDIVSQAKQLRDKYTDQIQASVNYACVFCQTEQEFNNFNKQAQKLGKVMKQTETGPIYLLNKTIETEAGLLKLLKIRKPDPTRPERGDADFTVDDYQNFKKKYLNKPNFKLIVRQDFEMIELYIKGANVRVYFSHPTLLELLNMKNN